MTRWLDDRYLDPIVGLLIPGGGDMLSSALGVYALLVASRRKVPAATRARMLLNLALDGLIGAIPVIGDLFDAFFKAHKRNLALLERPPTRRSSAWDYVVLAGAGVLFLAAVALPILGLVWLFQALF